MTPENSSASPAFRWKKGYWLILFFLLLGFAGIWAFGFYESEVLDYLRRSLVFLHAYQSAHPALTPVWYLIFYALVLTVMIPADMVLMVLGGALFGVWAGTLLACTGHTVGATINFIFSKQLFRRFEQRTGEIQPTLSTSKNTWFYLLILRMTPLVPAHGISLMMGATTLGALEFALGTWAGSLPMSWIFAYLGTHLEWLQRPGALMTPPVLLGMAVVVGLLVLMKIYGNRYLVRKGWIPAD